MRGIIFRWIISAGGLLLVSYLFDGIKVASVGWAFIAAIFLGIFNAMIRPVVFLLTLPINVLTMGLFTLVINGLMLFLTGKLLAGFSVEGFWSAVGGALVLSLISLFANSSVNENGRVDVVQMRRRSSGRWERLK
ncbi:phage holin family protein [Dethiosulfatarculus sandiegensis]|uniref:Membrane protein n=1 Tax=Dethiosulfatarculus sandiegensis TaxID=1429043 RepID=A0A0D2J742_9BACT|nr:phage holin family protein [Dethiosulfatarculus sandiegensis]KIX11491.1 membrane protein [Dethiosulfatarculus sandiegensis]